MAELRKLILTSDKETHAAKSALEYQSAFLIEGDMYKRSRYSDYPEDLRLWLDRKTVCFSCHPDIETLFADNLAEHITAVFEAMKPVYEFLVHAENEAMNINAEN